MDTRKIHGSDPSQASDATQPRERKPALSDLCTPSVPESVPRLATPATAQTLRLLVAYGSADRLANDLLRMLDTPSVQADPVLAQKVRDWLNRAAYLTRELEACGRVAEVLALGRPVVSPDGIRLPRDPQGITKPKAVDSPNEDVPAPAPFIPATIQITQGRPAFICLKCGCGVLAPFVSQADLDEHVQRRHPEEWANRPRGTVTVKAIVPPYEPAAAHASRPMPRDEADQRWEGGHCDRCGALIFDDTTGDRVGTHLFGCERGAK